MCAFHWGVGFLTFRLGRQELAYGSSRLISAREAPNVRQSFDGVKAILNLGGWRVDAFAVKPVRTKTGAFDDDPDPDQKFWDSTLWLQFPGCRVEMLTLLPRLDRNNAHFDQGTAHEIRHSLGTRIWGRKAEWDYNFEFVYQFGTFGSGDIQHGRRRLT